MATIQRRLVLVAPTTVNYAIVVGAALVVMNQITEFFRLLHLVVSLRTNFLITAAKPVLNVLLLALFALSKVYAFLVPVGTS